MQQNNEDMAILAEFIDPDAVDNQAMLHTLAQTLQSARQQGLQCSIVIEPHVTVVRNANPPVGALRSLQDALRVLGFTPTVDMVGKNHQWTRYSRL